MEISDVAIIYDELIKLGLETPPFLLSMIENEHLPERKTSGTFLFEALALQHASNCEVRPKILALAKKNLQGLYFVYFISKQAYLTTHRG